GWSWYKNTSRNGNIFKKFKPKCGLRFSYQILLLFQELEDKDRSIVFAIIDKMLTTKKFKDFFNNNAALL
ncbi:hypothetical protein B0A78_12855, partial [Flavobacterium columnare NBRC 100251 = ATCC 23463]